MLWRVPQLSFKHLLGPNHRVISVLNTEHVISLTRHCVCPRGPQENGAESLQTHRILSEYGIVLYNDSKGSNLGQSSNISNIVNSKMQECLFGLIQLHQHFIQ